MKFKDVIDHLNSGGMVRFRLWQEGEYLICDKQQNKYYHCVGKHRSEFTLTPKMSQRDCWEIFEYRYTPCIICGKFPIYTSNIKLSTVFPNDQVQLSCSDHSWDGIPHDVIIYGPNEERVIQNWNLVNKYDK